MLHKKRIWVPVALAMAMLLGACNIGKSPEPTADVNALYTAAAGTLVAQFNEQQTQTAQAMPPTAAASPTLSVTLTPLPTFPGLPGLTPFSFGTPLAGLTPLPTLASGASGFAVGCNNAEFYGETIPDGTQMDPEEKFRKAWMMQNTGTCKWDQGYMFAFKSGDRMDGADIRITDPKDSTAPGHSQTFVVTMWAPKAKGEYKGYWQMKNDTGTWFGSLVSVVIEVK
jgi:Ig-like domain-containing protein